MIAGIIAGQDGLTASGSPPGAAGAVHFAGGIQGNGPTYLSCPWLSCAANGLFAFSYWATKFADPANNAATIWVVDPAGDYDTYASLFTRSAVTNTQLYSFCNSGVSQYWDGSYAPVPSSPAWIHFLGSGDMNHASGSKIFALYINDVKQSVEGVDDAFAAFNVDANGKAFFFGDDGNGYGPDCDFFDVWIAPGIGIHQSDGTILEADRRKFINADLTPADPSGFPSSAILFTGGASSFITNRGTGGAFTLTGALTDAATHP